MKFQKKSLVLLWVLALLPIAATALLYSRLPDRIPMHWGIDGAVRYDPKASIWMMLAMGPVFAVLLPLLTKIDPRKKNYEKFSGIYEGFAVVIMLFLSGMAGIILCESLAPKTIDVAKVVPIGVGLLFVWIGNIMPKVRSNFFFGIKTPWSLSDPKVWERTNRLGGYCFFGGGILIVLSSLLIPERLLFYVIMGMVVVIGLVPTVMSYVWYRRFSSEQ